MPPQARLACRRSGSGLIARFISAPQPDGQTCTWEKVGEGGVNQQFAVFSSWSSVVQGALCTSKEFRPCLCHQRAQLCPAGTAPRVWGWKPRCHGEMLAVKVLANQHWFAHNRLSCIGGWVGDYLPKGNSSKTQASWKDVLLLWHAKSHSSTARHLSPQSCSATASEEGWGETFYPWVWFEHQDGEMPKTHAMFWPKETTCPTCPLQTEPCKAICHSQSLLPKRLLHWWKGSIQQSAEAGILCSNHLRCTIQTWSSQTQVEPAWCCDRCFARCCPQCFQYFHAPNAIDRRRCATCASPWQTLAEFFLCKSLELSLCTWEGIPRSTGPTGTRWTAFLLLFVMSTNFRTWL